MSSLSPKLASISCTRLTTTVTATGATISIIPSIPLPLPINICSNTHRALSSLPTLPLSNSLSSSSSSRAVTRSLYRATIQAARAYDMVAWQRTSLVGEPAVRSWLPARAIDWSLRDDTCVELVRRAFRSRTNRSMKNIGGAQNAGFAALRALARHQSIINGNQTTFQGALIRLLEAETNAHDNDDTHSHTDTDTDPHTHIDDTYHDTDISSTSTLASSNAPLSIIGTVAHTRARSATYPHDDTTTRSRPYPNVPLRAVPHDSLPAFATTTTTTPTSTSTGAATPVSNTDDESRVPSSSPSSQSSSSTDMDDDDDSNQQREWRRIKTMVLSQLLDQSNEVTQLPHYYGNNSNNNDNTSSIKSPLSRQFASAGIAESITRNKVHQGDHNSHSHSYSYSNGNGRGERDLATGAHMFSWHRPLRRVSYDALLNVSVQEKNIPLALAVLNVMSASHYQLSSSMQISLAEMFARASHMNGALHVLRLSVWGHHARSLPSCVDGDGNGSNGIATPRDVDPNDPVWLRVLNPVMFAVAQNACNNNNSSNGMAHDLFQLCQSYGITPNRGTYEALLLSCYYAKDPVAATRVLESMKASGLPPSLSCYNAVLHTCSFDGAAAESFRLVSQMKADNVQPNVDTYFWTYQSALKANDTHGMQMVLLAAKEQGLDPNAVSAGAVINA